MRTGLVVVVLLAVLGSCTASLIVPLVATGAEDEALALVPTEATLYATAYLRPSLSQGRAVSDLLSRFGADQQVDALLNQAAEPLAQVGLSYETDIKPWLGDQVAVFVLPAQAGQEPDGAALLATSDPAAARITLDKVFANAGVQPETRNHAGTDYQVDPASGGAVGLVGGFLVAGTERGLTAAVDATGGGGLAARPEYVQTASTLPTDNLLSVWADPDGLAGLAGAASQLPESMGLQEAGLGQQQPTAVALRMEDDALVFESATLVDDAAGPAAEFTDGAFLGQLPAGVVAAIGIPALGQVGTRLLDTVGQVPGGEGAQAIEEGFLNQTGLSLRNDVLAWMGDTALFVSGSTPQAITGGITVTSSDPAATARVVETLRTQAEGLGLAPTPVQVEGLSGFSVQQGAPAPVTVVGGPRLIAGYGAGAVDGVVAPQQRLADSEVFGAATGALGSGWMTTLFIDVGAARTLGEAAAGGAAALGPTYGTEVAPRLSQVRAVVAGTRREGDTTRQRLAVVFTEG